MATLGKVREVAAEFEWQIEDFLSLPEKDGESCDSPSFSFAGESWYFVIYPNGRPKNNAVGYVEMYLYRKLEGPPISLACSFGVKTFEGKTYRVEQFSHVFEKAQGYGFYKFLKRSELSEKKSELMPSDALTLVCHIDYYSKSKDGAGSTATAVCSHCKQTWDAEYLSAHEKKCLDKPIKCPTCENVVELREWYDHECDSARVKATEELMGDLANILENGEHSDVTITVKDKEFRLHRSILSARNPYFNSMFKTDMKENSTGIVNIDDCDPDIFQSFINYVYTGKLHTLSCDNVRDLYEVADKYQEDQLKSECLCYMKNKMAIDSFVDFIVLALKHDEKELLQSATDFFCRKTKEIIRGVKWQTFMRQYPTEANELHIKVLDYFSSKYS